MSLARDLGVNISGIAIILQMRERMEEMQRQMQDFVKYIQEEVLSRAMLPRSRQRRDRAGATTPGATITASPKTIAAAVRELATDNWSYASPSNSYLQR